MPTPENLGTTVALNCLCTGPFWESIFVKSWGIFIVTAMGFLAGLILAGVGVTSAKSFFSDTPVVEKKADAYWYEANLSTRELTELISNANCQSSEKYFLSCVNSLLQVLPKYHLTLSPETGLLSQSEMASIYDGKTEKENLQPFLKIYNAQKNQSFQFDELWEHVLSREPLKEVRSAVIGAGINGFLSVYKDPHTYVLPGQFFEEVSSKNERSNLFVGIAFEKKDGRIFVRKVFKNSDAEAAGLQEQDQLIMLNGNVSKFLNLSDISLALRNPEAAVFDLTIKRSGQFLDLKITRSFRILSHVSVEKEVGLRNYSVITISKFTRGICAEVTKHIKNLSVEAVAGMVLDLRDNPGGELNEAACLAGLFIGMNKKIYSVKYFDPLKSDEVVLTTGSLLFTGPLVVLVNSSSASASELLAGALQDYNRAAIVGERTFGKGTFQESETWSKNAKISLFRTQGFYLLPSGASTQLKGVIPDFEQNENHVRTREETNYFNPIAAAEFSDTVARVRNFHDELKKCPSSVNFKKDDVVLRKGLEVLSCHRISAVMAGFYSQDDFNQ